MTGVGQRVVFQVDLFEAATVLQILIIDLRYEVALGVDVCDGLHLEQHARDLHEVVGGDVDGGEAGAGGQLPGQRGQLVAGHGQGAQLAEGRHVARQRGKEVVGYCEPDRIVLSSKFHSCHNNIIGHIDK